MPDLEQYFFRRMTPTYNCMDHTREVWLELTGEDLQDKLPKLKGDFNDRKVSLSGARTFKYLPEPVSPCIVLMQRQGETPHVGVYFDNGVLHLTGDGVEYQPLRIARRNYTSVRCYQ